ncbi:MAG TPA: hypothetical protein VHO01_01325 [Jatrophihabitans sp.]|nr:hypothetical protein [Jatrophihabitans sp.]
MNLDDAADQLYGLAAAELDRFSARRAELAKQARAGADRQLAAAIGKLAKPVLAAALANQLVRTEPAALARLQQLAAELRDAHRHLRGERLRELSEQRQQVLSELVGKARDAAGKPVSESVLNQLRATLEAAIADEAAEQAVLSGRLTAALSYSGFGAVDISDAVALPPPLRAVPDPVPDSGPAPEAAPSAADERARARAARSHAEALDQLDEAVQALDIARRAQREAAERVRRLAAELAAAKQAASSADEAVTAAERAHGRCARALERAEAAVAAAGGGATG